MKTIKNQIEIYAPEEDVWNILTDFSQYPAWNPLNPTMDVNLVVGEGFLLDSRITEKKHITGEPMEMLVCDPRKYEICWGSSRKKAKYPGVKSCRCQKIHRLDQNRTLLVHQMELDGILSSLAYFFYGEKLYIAFNKYCIALKKWAEMKENNGNVGYLHKVEQCEL